jgi:hypothetical protein
MNAEQRLLHLLFRNSVVLVEKRNSCCTPVSLLSYLSSVIDRDLCLGMERSESGGSSVRFSLRDKHSCLAVHVAYRCTPGLTLSRNFITHARPFKICIPSSAATASLFMSIEDEAVLLSSHSPMHREVRQRLLRREGIPRPWQLGVKQKELPCLDNAVIYKLMHTIIRRSLHFQTIRKTGSIIYESGPPLGVVQDSPTRVG